jgi:hypothetical protein
MRDWRGMMQVPLTARTKPPANSHFCVRPMNDLPSFRPALQVAGITGYERISAGIPVRDVRGITWKPAVVCASMDNKACLFAGIL